MSYFSPYRQRAPAQLNHLLVMPLRARILNAPFLRASGREMSSSRRVVHDIRPLPEDPTDDVLFSTEKGVRIIELNRPQKLNSLNGSMIRKIIPRLREWENSQLATAVVIRSTSQKSFCAGGDVASIVRAIIDQGAEPADQPPETASAASTYFALEYQLDHLIASYRQPYLAFMDGITMGGGVGLSCHAPFRIATEKTVFAMPETTIGFFPDVGTTFFLSRLENNVGKYLAVTSDRLNGIDALFSGVATHYMHSSSLPDLVVRLGELDFADSTAYTQRLLIIAEVLQEYTNALPYDTPPTLIGSRLTTIDRCFSPRDPNDIVAALAKISKDEKHDQADWAGETLQNIRLRSPTSIAVACKQMDIGKSWTIEEAFRREHALATELCKHGDFVEGVRSRLIDKPPSTPQWNPASLEEVRQAEIDKLFLTRGPTMDVLRERQGIDYKHYPWDQEVSLRATGGGGLPRESEVRTLLQNRIAEDAARPEGQRDYGNKFDENPEQMRRQILNTSTHNRPAKDAVEVKVRDVLSRRTRVVNNQLQWIP